MTKVSPDDPRTLIDGYTRGEAEAIRLVDSWIDVVLRGEFRSLEGEWDDLRQEVRIRVLRNLDGGCFDGRASLRTYVHRIARNTCIDATRKVWRARESGMSADLAISVPDRRPGAADSVMARDLLRRLLSLLDEEDRLMIRLVFLEHRSHQEVAGILGISPDAVKSRMARCKGRILRARERLRGTETRR